MRLGDVECGYRCCCCGVESVTGAKRRTVKVRRRLDSSIQPSMRDIKLIRSSSREAEICKRASSSTVKVTVVVVVVVRLGVEECKSAGDDDDEDDDGLFALHRRFPSSSSSSSFFFLLLLSSSFVPAR